MPEELTLNPQEKQQLISTLTSDLAKEAKNITADTEKLEEAVRDIEVPKKCQEKAKEFQTSLKIYANDLRLFCQKSNGALNAQKFVQRNKFNMWIKMVEEGLKTM